MPTTRPGKPPGLLLPPLRRRALELGRPGLGPAEERLVGTSLRPDLLQVLAHFAVGAGQALDHPVPLVEDRRAALCDGGLAFSRDAGVPPGAGRPNERVATIELQIPDRNKRCRIEKEKAILECVLPDFVHW